MDELEKPPPPPNSKFLRLTEIGLDLFPAFIHRAQSRHLLRRLYVLSR